MKKFLLATAAAAAFAVPASAEVYNVASFGGPFSYGQYEGGTTFTTFSGSCSFGTQCVSGPQGGAQVVYSVPGLLVAHPGTNAAANTAVVFTAPRSTTYTISGIASLADTRPEANGGDGVTLAGYFNGGLIGATPLVGPGNSLAFPATSLFLAAGQQIGLVITPNGGNSYDSVGITGSISAIPEPATWAMMILGFGLIGAAMRRSGKPKVAVAYA